MVVRCHYKMLDKEIDVQVNKLHGAMAGFNPNHRFSQSTEGMRQLQSPKTSSAAE